MRQLSQYNQSSTQGCSLTVLPHTCHWMSLSPVSAPWLRVCDWLLRRRRAALAWRHARHRRAVSIRRQHQTGHGFYDYCYVNPLHFINGSFSYSSDSQMVNAKFCIFHPWRPGSVPANLRQGGLCQVAEWPVVLGQAPVMHQPLKPPDPDLILPCLTLGVRSASW